MRRVYKNVITTTSLPVLSSLNLLVIFHSGIELNLYSASAQHALVHALAVVALSGSSGASLVVTAHTSKDGTLIQGIVHLPLLKLEAHGPAIEFHHAFEGHQDRFFVCL